MNIDLKVAMKQFSKRKKANSKKKQIDNASLYAGSPMYFYCKFCGEPTDTLPESYTCTPKTVCDPCEILHLNGLI
jgi:hypothetical protein